MNCPYQEAEIIILRKDNSFVRNAPLLEDGSLKMIPHRMLGGARLLGHDGLGFLFGNWAKALLRVTHIGSFSACVKATIFGPLGPTVHSS